MFLYLDTSALVKRYVAEASSDEVVTFMEEASAVGTSIITQTEVAAALAKAVRDGRLADADARHAYEEFLQEWPDFGRVPVTDALVARAGTLAWDHGLRAYDAVQLAAALACRDAPGTPGEIVVFACFDNQLREAATNTGLQTWPVGDEAHQ